MGFNNGLERKKFEASWARMRMEYAAAGMSAATIEQMYEFDLAVFNSDRRFAEHTQGIPDQKFDDDGDEAGDDNSALLKKFPEAFSVQAHSTDTARRGSWVDEIEDEKIAAALRQLSPEDIELLTLYAFEGYTVIEIASMKGIAHQNVSKKIRRIKKFLKNF